MVRRAGRIALCLAVGLTVACASSAVTPAPAPVAPGDGSVAVATASTAAADGSSAGAPCSPSGAARPRALTIETFPDPPQAGAVLIVVIHGLSPGERVCVRVTPGGPATAARTSV